MRGFLSKPGRDSDGALRTVFRFLRPYYRPHRFALFLLALCVLAETSYNVAFPLSLKYLVDDALLREDRSALARILIVLGALAGLQRSPLSWRF
jgi:ABC-type multidrug transport system fused ATPase/permease subunit